jgi:hypothetical protein
MAQGIKDIENNQSNTKTVLFILEGTITLSKSLKTFKRGLVYLQKLKRSSLVEVLLVV